MENAFEYGGYLWLVDLDDLPGLPRGLGWAARFDAADHLGDPGSSIKANVGASPRCTGWTTSTAW